MPYTVWHMIFIETSAFTNLLSSYLSDEDYRRLQSYLLKKPDAGDIVKGSGGVRKVRWAADGKGKRGGVRVIYYWKNLTTKFGCLPYIRNPREQRFLAIF